MTVLHDNAETATADWDATLRDLWQDLQNKTGKLTGKQVQDNSDVATAASCSLLVKPAPNLCSNMLHAAYVHTLRQVPHWQPCDSQHLASIQGDAPAFMCTHQHSVRVFSSKHEASSWLSCGCCSACARSRYLRALYK